MASSLSDKAQGRAADVQAAIRGLLAKGKSHAAFNKSIEALQGEAAKVRRWRGPAAAAVIDAELAASVAALAARLHAHKPQHGASLDPEHLLATFDAIYEAGGDRS